MVPTLSESDFFCSSPLMIGLKALPASRSSFPMCNPESGGKGMNANTKKSWQIPMYASVIIKSKTTENKTWLQNVLFLEKNTLLKWPELNIYYILTDCVLNYATYTQTLHLRLTNSFKILTTILWTSVLSLGCIYIYSIYALRSKSF